MLADVIQPMIKLMTVRRVFLVLATLAIPAAAASAAATAWTPSGATACYFSGWTTNEKSAIAVRDAPSSQGRVVGSLPTTRGDNADPDIDYYSVTFDVTEAREGWLKIRNASDAMTGGDVSQPRPVFGGAGWIEAADAQVGIQSARGYARPDADSERLLDLRDDWLTERATLRGIVACDGDWLLLDYEMRNSEQWELLPPEDRVRGRAWFRGVCASAETTCDMPSVDKQK